MLQIELNGTEPKHVERIKPAMSTGITGEVNWTPSLLDYDVSRFFRGKQVTNEEFNELFLQQLYQGNYITDSLTELFKTHLGTAIYRTFTHTFDLKKSYTKVFSPAEWGTIHEDGYYYISIPAEEHGFLQTGEESAVDNMNVDTEMYVLDSDGQFHEVMQVEVDTDNTIHLYTDDNTLAGFVVVRSNDKSFRLADDVEIDASDVKGLHPVAVSGRYQDLDGINDPGGPVPLINKNAEDILKIIEGPTVVNRAETAGHSDTTNAVLLDGTIQGIPVSNIFETGSNYVKDATHAANADNAVNASLANIAQYASADSSKGTIEERLTRLGFKQGTMSLNSATISQNPTISVNSLKRQGNYVIFEFKSSGTFKYSGETYKETIDGYEYTFTMISIGTLPADFVPLNDLNPTVLAKYSVYVTNKYETRYSIGLQITKDGRVWIQNGIAGFTDSEKNIMDLEFCLGYEAKPL